MVSSPMTDSLFDRLIGNKLDEMDSIHSSMGRNLDLMALRYDTSMDYEESDSVVRRLEDAFDSSFTGHELRDSLGFDDAVPVLVEPPSTEILLNPCVDEASTAATVLISNKERLPFNPERHLQIDTGANRHLGIVKDSF